jgi:hypothetical protein
MSDTTDLYTFFTQDNTKISVIPFLKLSMTNYNQVRLDFAGHDHHQAPLDLGAYQEIIAGAKGERWPQSGSGTPRFALGRSRMDLRGRR